MSFPPAQFAKVSSRGYLRGSGQRKQSGGRKKINLLIQLFKLQAKLDGDLLKLPRANDRKTCVLIIKVLPRWKCIHFFLNFPRRPAISRARQ
jgi:hypothetical protein